MKGRYAMVLMLCCSAAAEARFVDIAQSAGVDFVHRSGAAVCALFARDLWLWGRVFGFRRRWRTRPLLGQRRAAAPSIERARSGQRALRNNGAGRFSEQTARAGVGDRGYGMGATVGDWDNDGRADLYVTNFGANALFHNRGQGRFADVTATTGVGCPGWGTSAAFADVDLDGDLDLFVGNYLDYPTEDPLVCRIGNRRGAALLRPAQVRRPS